MDTIAVAGQKAHIGQQISFVMTDTNLTLVVDLNTYEVMAHEIKGVSTGMATIPLNQIHIPVIQGG